VKLKKLAPGAGIERIADAAETAVALDWRAIAKRAGLKIEETSLLLLVYRDRVPILHARVKLGITYHQATKLRDRVLGKLPRYIAEKLEERPKNGSLHPSFQRRLPSGKKTWELAQLDRDFLAVLDRERQNLFSVRSQQDTANFQKSQAPGAKGRRLNLTEEKLNNKLDVERTTLRKLQDRADEALRAFDLAYAEWTAARELENGLDQSETQMLGAELRNRVTDRANAKSHAKEEFTRAQKEANSQIAKV